MCDTRQPGTTQHSAHVFAMLLALRTNNTRLPTGSVATADVRYFLLLGTELRPGNPLFPTLLC